MTKEALLKKVDDAVVLCEQMHGAGFSTQVKRLQRLGLLGAIKRKLTLRAGGDASPHVIAAQFFTGEKMYVTGHESSLLLCGILGGSELRLTKYFIKRIEAKDTFFDIGSHHGYYSMALKPLLPNGKIHAFEPSPEHFAVLEKNLKGLENVTINKFGVYSTSGEIVFYENKKGASTHDKEVLTDLPRFNDDDFREIKIPVQTLDMYCEEQHVVPNVLKIDVEGAELDVLKGGIETITKHDISIAVELWREPIENKTHKEAVALLATLGYKPHKILDNGDLEALDEVDFKADFRDGAESDNFIFKK